MSAEMTTMFLMIVMGCVATVIIALTLFDIGKTVLERLHRKDD